MNSFNKLLAVRIPPSITKESKATRERCIGLPVMISKGESLCFPKGVDLRFKRTIIKSFDQGIFKTFKNLVESLYSFILFTNPEDYGC